MKTYKGLDLVKAVAKHEINSGTKLKCVNYPTYGQGVEVDERQRLIWSDTKEPISYGHFNDSLFEFEVIEEEKEIEELNYRLDYDTYDKCKYDIDKVMTLIRPILKNKDKINELVREVRKLKEKL